MVGASSTLAFCWGLAADVIDNIIEETLDVWRDQVANISIRLLFRVLWIISRNSWPGSVTREGNAIVMPSDVSVQVGCRAMTLLCAHSSSVQHY